MTRNHIYHSELFDLVSYDNGVSYALHDNKAKRSLFVQDEDADELRSAIELWEHIDPDKPYDEIYAEIMSEYDAVTEITK